MNRDWFARTQPETDGKLEVIRQYPPMLFIDAHEFGLSNYFFPPNADPEYHEIPDTAHDWINELYSPAIVDAVRGREGIKYFHGAPYDFFAIDLRRHRPDGRLPRRRDDLREGERRPDRRARARAVHLDLGVDPGRRDGARRGRRRLARLVRRRRTSRASTACSRTNNVYEKGHDLYQPVPDVAVRHYFLRDDPDRAYELQLLVRRLQRMDVDVQRLTAPLALADFHPYGDPATADDAAGRDLLDPAGPGPEALDPGDAPRGVVDPVRRRPTTSPPGATRCS